MKFVIILGFVVACSNVVADTGAINDFMNNMLTNMNNKLSSAGKELPSFIVDQIKTNLTRLNGTFPLTNIPVINGTLININGTLNNINGTLNSINGTFPFSNVTTLPGTILNCTNLASNLTKPANSSVITNGTFACPSTNGNLSLVDLGPVFPVGNITKMNCTGNTVYLECGTCERTCGVSSFICTMECKRPGCYCLGNFARDGPNGTCIPDTKCKNAVLNSTLSGTTEPTIIGDYKCAANLTYTDCGACESTCADPLNICPSSCKPKGCYCSGGYVRTGNSNSTCISYLDCPNSTPQSMETFFIMANPEALREARKAKEAHHIQMGIAIGEPNPNTAA